MDYRARAGAAILTSWSRSRAKVERLHNTDWRNHDFFKGEGPGGGEGEGKAKKVDLGAFRFQEKFLKET